MLPIPLGEGWGEGIEEQCKNSSPYLFPVWMREKRTKGGCVLSPHPNPLPKGEGMLLKITN